jgi:HlyD family secretion protein
MEQMHAQHKAIAVALTMLVLLGAFLINMWEGPDVPIERVVRRNLIQSVVAGGRVENPHRMAVGVQITGTVTSVPVAEGERVMRGTLLLGLDAQELQAALRQALWAEQQAVARMRQLRELQEPVLRQSMLQAQANHTNAQRHLERTQILFEKGFVGGAARDESGRAERVAAHQLNITRQQWASVSEDGSEIAAANAAIALAKAAVEVARARLTYTQVQAPVSGTLIARHVEPGDVVQPGKALMALSPEGVTQLVVQIDEKNLKWVRVGQKALASTDAYASENFEAMVSYMNPGVDAQRGSVEVKLDVPHPPDYLRQDMTVSVDIEVATREKALLVPNTSVHDLETSQPWVLRVTQGQAHRQAVKIGWVGQGWSEVLGGLNEGDHVVPLQATSIKAGSRLKAIIPVQGPAP